MNLRYMVAPDMIIPDEDYQIFKIHFKRKCPQRQITECLRVKLKGFAILKHSKR